MRRSARAMAVLLALFAPASMPVAAACSIEPVIVLGPNDAAALGWVEKVRWAGLAIRHDPWRIVSVRKASVATERVLKGQGIPRRFEYTFTEHQPDCGARDGVARKGARLIFLFDRRPGNSGKMKSYDALDERTYREWVL